MDFIAIDFETANNHPTSACSIGLAFVRDGRLCGHTSYFIRPEPFYFDPFTTAIHGLTEQDVRHAPTFAQLWPEISAHFENAVVAAHNAPFDIGVLRSTLAFYGLPLPDMRLLCTVLLSRRAFPALPSHRLNVVSDALGISLTHHQAESDAIACAGILCHLMQQNHLQTLGDVKRHFRVFPGSCSASGGYRPCRLQPSYALPGSLLEAWENGEAFCDSLYEKSFVFSGKLQMPRAKAMEAVIRGGGMVQNCVSSYTDYLVLGAPGRQSSQKSKALALRQRGGAIQIIDEHAFLSLMDARLLQLCFPSK